MKVSQLALKFRGLLKDNDVFFLNPGKFLAGYFVGGGLDLLWKFGVLMNLNDCMRCRLSKFEVILVVRS